MLQDMTTEEIAEAVEARKPWRNVYCRIYSIARKGAFTWFVFGYLLCAGIGILWGLAVALCVLVLELRTNRLTIRTYSTVEIVGYLMKRVTVERNRTESGRKIAIGGLIFLFGFALRIFDVPIYVAHVFYFSGLAWLVIGFKITDNVKNPLNSDFCVTRTRDGATFLQVAEYVGSVLDFRPRGNLFDFFWRMAIHVCWLMICAAALIVAYVEGGVRTFGAPEHEAAFVAFTIVFPAFGCATHETWRFRLVQDELERMNETTERRR